jgi:ABC-type Fe3+-hydroxamate transport system substrate-binding protein
VSPSFEQLSEAGTRLATKEARIVSLVPSITESLFALGLGDRVVGVTDWCIHPKDAVAALPKLGGTKDPDVAAIAAREPDLVIANHEENTRRVVGQLVELGLQVWVTYPRTVREGAELLLELTRLGASEASRRDVALPVVQAVEVAEALGACPALRPRVFCPIWRDPWMTAGPDTYVHDMVELCGGSNLIPATASTADAAARRYPKLDLETLTSMQPDVVLLPDEPYAFGDSDVDQLAALDIPAAGAGRIHLIDGTWVSWYGPRIATAIRGLRGLLAPA